MYTARRDHRFEYVWEVMEFIEENQCVDCTFRANDPDTPMCGEIEAELIMEKPVAALDDRGDDGVYCTRYRNDVLQEEAHPDQGRLL